MPIVQPKPKPKEVTADKKKRHPPVLPQYGLVVKASGTAVVYTDDGDRISNDAWTWVPTSPHIIMAIKSGDLEEAEEGEEGKAANAPAAHAPAPKPAAPSHVAPPPAVKSTP